MLWSSWSTESARPSREFRNKMPTHSIAKRVGEPTPISANPPMPVRKPIWVDPPDQWENVDLLNYIALPAQAAQSNVISFKVPNGRNGVIRKVGNNFVGGGWVEGSGAVVWQILVDGAPPPGAVNYDSILGSLGSPANPVEIAGFRIFEGQTLTLVVKNILIVVAGQLSGGRFVGYLYPREMEGDHWWL
jgi:hypothetical protein